MPFGHKVLLASLYVMLVILPNAGAMSTSAEFLYNARFYIVYLQTWETMLKPDACLESVMVKKTKEVLVAYLQSPWAKVTLKFRSDSSYNVTLYITAKFFITSTEVVILLNALNLYLVQDFLVTELNISFQYRLRNLNTRDQQNLKVTRDTLV